MAPDDAAPAAAGVLYVLVRADDPRIYGGEKSTLMSARGLAARGWRPRFLATARDDLARAAEAEGIACEVVDVRNPFDGLRRASMRERLGRLQSILAVNRAVGRGTEPIVHAGIMYGFYCSWLGARWRGARVVYHIRGSSRRTRPHEWLPALLADRSIAVSESLKQEVVTAAPAVLQPALARRIDVVPNGFDFAAMDAYVAGRTRADARRALGVGDELLAVYVGALGPRKAQLEFIERVLPRIAADVPRFRVVFIGGDLDPAYAASCRAAVERLGLGASATFAGYCAEESLFAWYRAADLGLSAAEREGLPRAVVEMQAFGLPVVATAVTGNVDVVADGTTGHLTAPDRPLDMAGKIVALCRDDARRAAMADTAAASMRARFDLARNVAALEAIYRDVLAG